jgi:acyl-CoA synthetase (AMP-forming)/AMP-acid ligase II
VEAISVFLNWALGLRALGCRVIWLEWIAPGVPSQQVENAVRSLKEHLAFFAFDQDLAVAPLPGAVVPRSVVTTCLDLPAAASVDLLLKCSKIARFKLRHVVVLTDVVPRTADGTVDREAVRKTWGDAQ